MSPEHQPEEVGPKTRKEGKAVKGLSLGHHTVGNTSSVPQGPSRNSATSRAILMPSTGKEPWVSAHCRFGAALCTCGDETSQCPGSPSGAAGESEVGQGHAELCYTALVTREAGKGSRGTDTCVFSVLTVHPAQEKKFLYMHPLNLQKQSSGDIVFSFYKWGN